MDASIPGYDELLKIKHIDVVERLISIAIQQLRINSVKCLPLSLSYKQLGGAKWRFRLNYGQWLVLDCEFENDALAGVQIAQGFPKGKAPYDTLFANQTMDTDVGLDYFEFEDYAAEQTTIESRFERSLKAGHSIFGTWSGSPFTHAHQQELFENLLRLRYRWVAFLEELGTRLAGYRDRQLELVQLLGQAGVDNGLVDRDADGKDIPMLEIDPFTVLAALNKFGDEKRIKLINKFGRLIGVTAPEFATINGMPTANARGFWYMPFVSERRPDQVSRLWDFFEKVIRNQVATPDLASAAELQYVGPANLTQGMFWVRPSKFMPFDEKTVGAVRQRRTDLTLPDVRTFPTGYLELLNSLRTSHGESPWLFAAWSELGHQITVRSDLQNLIASMIGLSPATHPTPETEVKDGSTKPYSVLEMAQMPLNSILYGPPGTGKTYATRERALKIIDGLASTDVKQQQDRYRHLLDKGQVRFVTFHQSYAYENFVEGIRPRVQQSGALSYEVEAGILKQIAEKATQAWELSRSTHQQDPLNGLDRTKTKFWKCSLGQAGSDVDADVYPYCMENNMIAIAYGEESVDLTSAKTHEDVEKLTQGKVGNAAHVRYLRQLAIDMKVGDIVVVPSSVHTIRAIGRVVGPYRFDLDVPDGYCHTRPVEWLHKDVSIPVRLIYDGQLTQPAIKPLSQEKIVLHHPAQQQSTEPERFVLIIDEINRGNISNILGEAITLLEEDKRLGQPNEITVQLPYSKEAFCLPPNLYIVGTMNTADRSIALVDMALRRRFVFEELMANMSLLPTNIDGIDLSRLLTSINDRLELLLDRDHTIGHAYFMGCASVEDVSRVLVQKIIPLLQEYFYDDLERIGNVLNDHANKQQPIILKETLYEMKLFGNDLDGIQDGARYRIPTSLTAEQIIGIYA